MADPSYRAGSIGTLVWGAHGNTHTFTPGVVAASGELVFITLLVASANPPGAQAGWNLLGNTDYQISTHGYGISYYWKIAGAGEPSSYSLTTVGNVANSQGGIVIIQNVDQSTPIDVWAAPQNTNGAANPAHTGVTTTVANVALMAILNYWNGPGPTDGVVPTGFTEIVANSVIGEPFAMKMQAASGASGTATWTSGSDDYQFALFGIRGTGTLIREQEGFRFRDDNGSESAASWLASQDTNISRPKLTNTRLRVLTNVTLDPPSEGLKLQYRKVGDPNWRDVT